MEWWAIFLMVIVLATIFICITYFILKIYFPYHFATFMYHINTKGHYASNVPPTLATFRSKSEGDFVFTETGCYAKQNLASNRAELFLSKDNLPAVTDSTILLEGVPSPLGQLQVGLDVDYDTSDLIVIIIQAKEISLPENVGGIGNENVDIKNFKFYVCVDLLHTEDAISSAKTKTYDHDTVINFKERFLFKINVPDLTRKVVRFRMIGINITESNKHTELSKAVCPISDINIAKAKKLWLNLKEMHIEEDARGEIMLSLTYLPTASRITIVIIKAKNLKWKLARQKVGDLVASVSLIINGKRMSKRQTSVKRKVRDPVFNESLIFSVSNPGENVMMRVTISEILPTGRLYTVGYCILGPTASGSELTHWQQMVANPRRPSAMWHWLHKKINVTGSGAQQQQKRTGNRRWQQMGSSSRDPSANDDGTRSAYTSDSDAMAELPDTVSRYRDESSTKNAESGASDVKKDNLIDV